MADASIESIATRKKKRAEGLWWCSSHKDWALARHMVPNPDGTPHSRCRSCDTHSKLDGGLLSGNALLADNEARYQRWLARQSGAPIRQAVREERAKRKQLGIRAKPGMTLQTDVEGAVIDAGGRPGSIRTLPANLAPEVIIADRQATFEKREQQPKETRQQRRARERRIVKDAAIATSTMRRAMTEAEVAQKAVDRAVAARSRAAGGTAETKRHRKQVRWSLPPEVVGKLIKQQGYRCALTGRPFEESTGYGSRNPFAPSPNRINPGGDYVEENCEYVLEWVNRLISDMPRPKALDFLAELKLLRKGVGQITLL